VVFLAVVSAGPQGIPGASVATRVGGPPQALKPQAFGREEVERAVAYAPRSFPDVLDLVPDFSVLTVGMNLEREKMAVLVLGDEREARDFRRLVGEGNLKGLLWEVALRLRERRRSASVSR
jgi:hypothetical protein